MCLDSNFLDFLPWRRAIFKLWGETKRLTQCLCLLSLFLSGTSNLSSVFCYCIIAFLDSIRQETAEKKANPNTRNCNWKTFVHSCLFSFLTLLITPSSSFSSPTMPAFFFCEAHARSRWHTDCFLRLSRGLYRNLAPLFSPPSTPQNNLRNCCTVSRSTSDFFGKKKKREKWSNQTNATVKLLMQQVNHCCLKEQTGSDTYHTSL